MIFRTVHSTYQTQINFSQQWFHPHPPNLMLNAVPNSEKQISPIAKPFSLNEMLSVCLKLFDLWITKQSGIFLLTFY